ncbi:MAG: aminotransferase class III-fold pyridoxal phosphate-dependent enzyme, partial [Chloroflexi bacterium]|nr:aminotransferase class III-fold pyridoxal phosphate-dependent enzyme [Chloroflexota bacterium]
MTLEPTVSGKGAGKSAAIGGRWAAQSSSELAARAQRVLMRIGNNFDGPVIARSQGARLWDADGKEYLDFGSGQLCATVGHNHPHVVAALQRAGASVIHLDTKLVSEDVILLAERLVAMVPSSLNRVTFVNTGSESTELAIKAAKRFTKGFEVVGIARSFHGLTGQAAASTYSYRRSGYGPQPPGHFAIPAPYCYRCPLGQTYPTCQFACIKTGFDLYDAQSVGAPAAFIAEPILSSGGIIEPPAGYFAELKRQCLERGLLLILDEAQ